MAETIVIGYLAGMLVTRNARHFRHIPHLVVEDY